MFMEDKCCICGKALSNRGFNRISINADTVRQFRCCNESICRAAVARMKKAIVKRQIEKWGSKLIKA
jgi:hypothetical protein